MKIRFSASPFESEADATAFESGESRENELSLVTTVIGSFIGAGACLIGLLVASLFMKDEPEEVNKEYTCFGNRHKAPHSECKEIVETVDVHISSNTSIREKSRRDTPRVTTSYSQNSEVRGHQSYRVKMKKVVNGHLTSSSSTKMASLHEAGAGKGKIKRNFGVSGKVVEKNLHKFYRHFDDSED